MPFLGRDLSPQIACDILAFCSPNPFYRFNGLPAASQDCYAHWSSMILRRAREIYLSFHAFRMRLNLRYRGAVVRLTPLEEAAINALDDLAELLGFVAIL